jgi:hypothetical protein
VLFCESICELLKPLTLKCPYIPALLTEIFDYFKSPLPYFIGLEKEFVDIVSLIFSQLERINTEMLK